MLRRLPLLFAVLVLGLALSAFIAERVIVSRVRANRTAPVRAAFEADWRNNLERLEKALDATAAWNASKGPLPASAYCALPWSGDAAALQSVFSACRRVDLTEAEPGWVDAFHAHDDWSGFLSQEGLVAGALPTLDAERLDDALGDELTAQELTELGRALLNAPTLSVQVQGLRVLERAGAPDREALKLARVAGALIWHPWTPKAARERVWAKLPPSSRCAAIDEAARIAAWGEPVRENEGAWLDEVRAAVSVACPQLTWSTSQSTWKQALITSGVVARGSTEETVVLFISERDANARAAVFETLLAVTLLKPFP